MKKLLSGAHDAIGMTPMVSLSRITKVFGVDGNIYAKMEYLNPGYSKKDRIALQMIVEAEEAGLIKPGDTIVEATSGNTGTGLSIVCACKGYKFVAVMSKGNSVERARMMKALGAELILVEQMPGSVKGEVSGEDISLVMAKADEIAKERNAFRVNQLDSIANTHAYEYHTAEEMWEQTDGNIDVFVDFIGTGGAFAGCANTLKKYKKSIKCYVVEPATAALYAGKEITDINHKIQGGGYNLELPLLNTKMIDGYIQVTNVEAIDVARKLARYEGLFVGFSSGANVCAALKLLAGDQIGKNIVLTLNDSGLKYLSTDLFDDI